MLIFAMSNGFWTNFGVTVTCVQVVGRSKVGSRKRLFVGGGQHGDSGTGSGSSFPSEFYTENVFFGSNIWFACLVHGFEDKIE